MKNLVKKILCWFNHDWETEAHFFQPLPTMFLRCRRCGERTEDNFVSWMPGIWRQ